MTGPHEQDGIRPRAFGMRRFAHYDVVLLAGLAGALIVVLAPGIATVLDAVGAIGRAQPRALVPALVILAGTFAYVQVAKRRPRWAASEDTTTAALVSRHTADVEAVVRFGHALARSLDDQAIRLVATEHLPALAGGRRVWALSRTGSQWRPLLELDGVPLASRERTARWALGEEDQAGDPPVDDICFSMLTAGTPVGVIGVTASPALGDEQRSVLEMAAALLAASLKNAALFREVHENSVRDSLTGCFTRKHTLEFLETELRRARRSRTPLSLVMFDLDHFKQINDTRGHLGGDAVLAEIGGRMKSVLRGGDVKCRYGGEEFLVVLPETPTAGGQHVAETLRREIGEQPVRWHDHAIPVTASFGVTSIVPGEIDPFTVMARADAALYRAKQRGRNCVQVDDPVLTGTDIGEPSARLPGA